MTCVLTVTSTMLGYTIEDLGPLPNDVECSALALNNLPDRSQAAGYSQTDELAARAILWEKVPGNPLQQFDLDADSGSVFSSASSLNSQFPRAVVGSDSFIGPAHPSPILWELSGRTVLPTLTGAGGSGEARAVNDSKVIVGWSSGANGKKRAARWTLGSQWIVEDLGTLDTFGPNATSQANGINQLGIVVGVGSVEGGSDHAFSWSPGNGLRDIHQGAGSSTALALNVHGDVVGEWDVGNETRAFHWSSSLGWNSLPGLPGSNASFATGINDNGVVVGESESNGPQAVLWNGGTIARLEDQLIQNPGWQLTRATAINNRGQIAGFGKSPGGNQHGWLLNPRILLHPFLKCTPGLPKNIVAQIVVAGGDITVTPDGKLIHIRPIKPDPAPMLTAASGLEEIRELLFADQSVSGRLRRQAVSELIPNVAELLANEMLQSITGKGA